MTDTSNGNGKITDTDLKLTEIVLALQADITKGKHCNGEHICLDCTKTYYCQSTAICRMPRDVQQCSTCWRKAQGFRV